MSSVHGFLSTNASSHVMSSTGEVLQERPFCRCHVSSSSMIINMSYEPKRDESCISGLRDTSQSVVSMANRNIEHGGMRPVNSKLKV